MERGEFGILFIPVGFDVEGPRTMAALAPDDPAGHVLIHLGLVVRVLLERFPNLFVALDALLGTDVGGDWGVFLGLGGGGQEQREADEGAESGRPLCPSDPARPDHHRLPL
jgi:hypothetical protein